MMVCLKLCVVALAVTIASPKGVSAQDAAAFGAGILSCATWTANSVSTTGAPSWIMGFWTGINALSNDRQVGKSVGSNGIVGEVRRACAERPSTLIWVATAEVYARLRREGR